MDQRRKKRRDLLQNIAIAVLSVSALVLLTQTQLYNLRPGDGSVSQLFAPVAIQRPQPVSGLGDLHMPVRLAVTGVYGRWADLTLTTGDEGFSRPGGLLREALGSAGSLRQSDTEAFLAALGNGEEYGQSVYFDFENPLPLSLLAELVGGGWTGPAVSARRLALVGREETVWLYLWSEEACFLCPTAVTARDLEELAAQYQLGSAYFAFDQMEHYAHLSPFSLFSDQFAPPPELSVSSSIADAQALMTALSFNPHTNFRYPEASGAEVVVDGERTLRFRHDGVVTYQGGGDTLRISAAGERPTVAEAVLGAYRLLEALVQEEAGLYLQSIRSGETVTVLQFGYQVQGMPVRFAGGGAAAEVVLEGSAVTGLALRLRQYTAGEEAGGLLPLPQALSIARKYPQRELRICYVDSGTSASLEWLAE